MARPLVPDARFDFAGGTNRSRSADSMDATELRITRNMRRDEAGSYWKRPSTRRIHATAIGSGARVMGGRQWADPSGNQRIIAVSNTDLYHKLLTDADFTLVAGTLSTTVPPRFQAHRAGATIVLYWADGGSVNKWDGTTLAESVSGAPDAIDLALYKGRLFGCAGKTLYWTQINEPENWAGGANADVETFDSEDLAGLLTVGSSLCMPKRNNIARFTGVSNADIRIDIESEGISQTVGNLARMALIPVERWGFLVHDDGPFLFDEADVYPIAANIKRYLLESVDRSNWGDSVAAYDASRRKLLWMYPLPSSNTQNAEGWEFDINERTWEGPITFQGFNASSLFQYERVDKSKALLIGGYDGFVRESDYTPEMADGLVQVGNLAIDAVPEKFKTTQTAIMQIALALSTKAATTALVFSASNTINNAQAAGQFWGAWRVQITAGGTVSTKVVASDQVYTTEALAIAALPSPDTSKMALGYITVRSKSGVKWTATTDDLVAASDCAEAHFYDSAVKSYPEAASASDHKDDKVAAGTGGTAIPGRVDLPDLIFGDPSSLKSLRAYQAIAADLGYSGVLQIVWTNEKGSTGTITINSDGEGVRDYPWRSKAKGTRLQLSFREETGNRFRFNGMALIGAGSGRRM